MVAIYNPGGLILLDSINDSVVDIYYLSMNAE